MVTPAGREAAGCFARSARSAPGAAGEHAAEIEPGRLEPDETLDGHRDLSSRRGVAGSFEKTVTCRASLPVCPSVLRVTLTSPSPPGGMSAVVMTAAVQRHPPWARSIFSGNPPLLSDLEDVRRLAPSGIVPIGRRSVASNHRPRRGQGCLRRGLLPRPLALP